MLDIRQYVYEMRETATPEEAFAVFSRHLADLGFDMALYSLMTDFHSIGLKAGHGVLYNYPEEWMAHYVDQGYETIDPVRQIAMRAREPFLWHELEHYQPLDKVQRRLMDESREAQLREGLAISVHGPCGEVMAMGMASSHGGTDMSPAALAVLRLMVQEHHSAFMRIHQVDRRAAAVALTPREHQVLRWLARGKTVPEIAIILSVDGSVSESTVRFHVRNLYEKLEARTAAQAVSRGLMHGCLTFADLNGYI